MSALHEQIDAVCPPQEIRNRLRHFFRVSGNHDEKFGKLHLRLRFHVIESKKTSVEHCAVATLRFRPLGADAMPRYQIEWAAERPGPYPLFYGTLAVSEDPQANGIRFDLQGQYTPPLGLFTPSFDMRVGRRIAHDTAAHLLHNLKHFVEYAYAAVPQPGPRTTRRPAAVTRLR